MPISKIKTSSILADAASTNLNIDAGTLFLDTTNNFVGISTTTPTAKLHVTTAGVASVPATSGTTLATGTLIRLGTSSDSAGGIGTIGLSTNQMWIQVTDSTNLATGNALLLNPNGGNVGIGTSSPVNKLQVAGAVVATGAAAAYSAGMTIIDYASGVSNITAIGPDTSTVGTTIFQSFSSNASLGGERMRITSAGNVGIGTTSPLSFGGTNLQVQNSNIGSIVWSNGTYIGQLLASASADVTIGSRSNHPLRFCANDTERMRIDTSGNVGIGTASPSTLILTIQGGGGQLRIRNTTTRYRSDYTVNNSGSTNINAYDDTGSVYMPFNVDASIITFSPSGTEKVRIDSSGNVGIGTTSPATKIDARGVVSAMSTGVDGTFQPAFNATYSGDTTFYATIAHSMSSIATSSGFRFLGGGLSNLAGTAGQQKLLDLTRGQTIFYTGDTERARIDSSGNVGIGTSSPNQKLQVNNTAATSSFALFTNATTGSAGGDGSYFGIDSSGVAYVWNQENLAILFGTNNGERMRINANGAVGIGNSSPAAQNLHVGSGAGGATAINGYTRLAVEASDYAVTTIKGPAANFSQIIFADSATTNLGGINYFNSTNATPNAMAFLTGGGTERMRIDNSGRVTMPYQPYLHATVSNGTTAINFGTTHANVTVPYNQIITNTGSHFNTSTNTFTCPVAGVYAVYAAIQVGGLTPEGSGVAPNMGVWRNGGSITGSFDHVGAAGYQKMETTAYIKCAANDTLTINLYTGSALTGGLTEFNGDVRNALCIAFMG